MAAKFECPSCASTITLQQTESKFREPSRCSCGRRAKFKLLAKELVDEQELVIQERQGFLKRRAKQTIKVLIREDLVDPQFERINSPGNYVRVTGVMRYAADCYKSFEKIIDANYIEPIESNRAG
ncbi:MAG: hypothetical protein ABIB71_02325 [Candidatus Woesearchaeota archaeon]